MPTVVWLLVAAQALLALGWTQLTPPWRAPDEPQHHDLVREVHTGLDTDWVGPDRTLSRQITATFEVVSFDFRDADRVQALTAAEAPAPAERRPFEQLAAPEPSDAENWLWQHPPGYYVVAGSGLSFVEALTPGGAPDFLAELATARAVSALLIAPLPLLAFAAARQLGAGKGAAVGAGALPLAVPQLAHIGGVVNNGSLLTLLVSAATVPLLAIATGDGRLRPAVATGGLFGAGLLVKGFALVGVGLIPLAAAAGWLRRRATRPVALRSAAGQAAAGLVAMGIVGGWWLARNVAVHGALIPSSYDPEPLADVEPSLWAWLVEAIPGYIQRFWGEFGWVQVTTIPFRFALAATVAVAALVAVAVWRRRRDCPGLAALAVALAPTAAIAAGVGWQAWSLHVEYGHFAFLHGRYMLPGLVGVAAVIAVAVDDPRVRRWWPLAVAVGALALTALGVAAAADFWAGEGFAALAAIRAWSPWPAWLAAVWATGSAATVVALVATAAMGRCATAAGERANVADRADR